MSGGVLSCHHLCVRDPVLPFDVENLVQAAEVETV